MKPTIIHDYATINSDLEDISPQKVQESIVDLIIEADAVKEFDSPRIMSS